MSIRSLVRAAFIGAVTATTLAAQAPSFSINQVRSNPFPNGLVAAPHGGRIAYALNEQGRRNVWVADAPQYNARQLTSYALDDGQELTSLAVSPDGKYVIYVRGGEHSANWEGTPPNPLSLPTAPVVQIWSVPFDGGTPKRLADGDDPAISPRGDVVAFVRDRAIWTVPIDGSSAAKRLFTANGAANDPQWSPNGSQLAFVSARGDHSMIGIFTDDSTRIRWIAPSTSRDVSPRWSPDGAHLAFVRMPGAGGAPDSVLIPRPTPWAIWNADARAGTARQIWKSPETLRGSIPGTEGGTNLLYAAGGRIVFLSEMDGWPHLYSISESGGQPTLLTPGEYMAEYVALSPDGKWLAFAGNMGSDADDIDRRHVVRVPVDRAAPEVMTPGTGLEWTPAFTGDGNSIALIGATAQRPPLPGIMPARGGAVQWIGAERIAADYPASQLVTPRKVIFKAPDGLEVHGQLFDAVSSASFVRGGKKPAVIFVHGGPPRQMLLGWNYSDYYSNAYASNQYLASRGFIVLSVNYRLGIGYGRDFQHPAHGGAQGASEYLDVQAAAKYLRSLPNVDASRIGIYGGSYGGFLTAMALSHNSDLFAAGVDIHGVHDWTSERAAGLLAPRYEKAPDTQRALDVAWKSSPISAVSGWKSPVLLIHGDDDRNVQFHQTVDLARRLAKQKVDFEELIIPDDTHHFLRHANWITVDSATAAYFERKFGGTSAAVGAAKQKKQN
ncbi:MAG: peptidase prolyl oligopeptidase active site protein [Gemmatimonadetes bacterium]|nr:peptidase prolyl oligopeptidase active site protein [Gemmatimonadota bacterium]